MPYGNDAKIGIAFQTAWGTQADVGSVFQTPFLNEDIGLAQEELLSENLNGRFDEGDAYSGRRDMGGTIEAEAQPVQLGAFVTAVVNDPTQVTSGAVETFTWTPRTADFDSNIPNRPVSYYKHLSESNSAQLFYDMGGSAIEFQMSEGGLFLVRTSFVGGKRASVGSQDIGLDTGRRWPWNQASASLGGVANTDITDINIVHTEGIEPRFTLDGTLTANRIKRTANRTIRVSGTLIFENQSELDNFASEALQQLILTVQDTSTEIQSGYYNMFQIDIPSFKWLEFKPPIPGPGEINVPFTGKAEYNSGSGTSVQYTLMNTYSAGYV